MARPAPTPDRPRMAGLDALLGDLRSRGILAQEPGPNPNREFPVVIAPPGLTASELIDEVRGER